MTLLNRLSGLAAAALVFVSAASAASVGEKAPDFTLTDSYGETHSLSDFAGKVVVLEWVNHGCPFVRKHYNSGNMQALQKSAKEKGVVWLTICSSTEGKQGYMTAAQWRKESEKQGVHSTATLIDESGAVGRSYGALVTPHMFVIRPDGVLAYDGAIDSIPSTSIPDLAKAENYVVAAMDAVLAGEKVKVSKSKPYGCGIKYSRDS